MQILKNNFHNNILRRHETRIKRKFSTRYTTYAFYVVLSFALACKLKSVHRVLVKVLLLMLRNFQTVNFCRFQASSLTFCNSLKPERNALLWSVYSTSHTERNHKPLHHYMVLKTLYDYDHYQTHCDTVTKIQMDTKKIIRQSQQNRHACGAHTHI